MRIVQLITGSAEFGGAQAHVRDLAVGIRAQGHDCTVVTGPPDGLFISQLWVHEVEVHVLPSLRKALRPADDLRALLQLLTKLRQLKPDLVAAHTAKAGFLGRFACAILGIPCVFTPHGWSIVNRVTGNTNYLFKILERLGGWLGSGVITVCHDERETGRTSRLTSPHKLFCVHNGIPDRTLSREDFQGDLTVLMVARFHKQKDHATVLRALSRLQRHPWRLMFIGAGPLMQENQQLAKALGIGGRVQYLGELDDTADLLSRSAVFVLGTFYEAFPISILEAMRAGLPVVATRVGGISEAVADGMSGFLVPPSRDDLMAVALERLFVDASLRERFGRKGREFFLEKFTDRQMVDRTLEVYRLVIERDSCLEGNVVDSPTGGSRQAAGPSV